MLHRVTQAENSTRVFVADDDDELRAVLVEALRDEGYVVVEARDGIELLTKLSDSMHDPAERPDVVVADVRMPKLSGLGVLEELKRAHVSLPVVLITGFAPHSVAVVAKRLGAVGVLKKPFELDDLRTAVMFAKQPLTPP
jgi:DNA-binding NtrC family response regulator